MASHNELGKTGENYAQQHLLSKGYKIRHTNWKSGKYELDIVAEKDGTLIFVEVKTRSTSYFGRPEEFVSNAKIRSTTNAADHYIRHFNINNVNIDTRFDIIGVLKTPEGNFNIEHIENAFLPIPFYY